MTCACFAVFPCPASVHAATLGGGTVLLIPPPGHSAVHLSPSVHVHTTRKRPWRNSHTTPWISSAARANGIHPSRRVRPDYLLAQVPFGVSETTVFLLTFQQPVLDGRGLCVFAALCRLPYSQLPDPSVNSRVLGREVPRESGEEVVPLINDRSPLAPVRHISQGDYHI